MLTSENGIREFHSGLKYGRIDIHSQIDQSLFGGVDGLASEEIWQSLDRVRKSG
jgi:hypothetical protein